MMPEKRFGSEDGPRRTPAQWAADQPRSAMVAFALLLGGAAASMFLVEHAEQGNVGVFLLCAGAAMICCPPRARVRPEIAVTAALFLLCSGSALLPARLFHLPVWRQAFASAPDLPLPATVSAAPEQTVFWLAVLTVTVLTGLFALTQPVRSRGLLSLAVAGAVVCGGYAALSILSKLPGWLYPFSTPGTFGFFPNRNHTATLLITGSVLSIGILGVAFEQRQRLAANVGVAALAFCVAGLLFFSESRGGVVFLVAGVVGWVAGLGEYRDRRLVVAVALTLLVGGGLFLTLKRGARDRLLASVPFHAGDSSGDEKRPAEGSVGGAVASGDITADDRVRIYHDTLDVIRDVPLTGLGLGTFPLVFAPYRLTSANNAVVVHPESDWLMVAAENGLPALFFLGVLIALVLRRWRPARVHPFWPLRWGLMAAAGAAALHGLVDVPMHRVALGWWVLVLAGLALQPGRIAEEAHGTGTSGRAARAVFALGGLAAVCLGGMLVRAEWLGGPALPPFAADEAQKEVAATFKRGDLEGATERCRQAINTSPLAPPLYYQLGLLLIREEDTDAEIDRAFRIQRLLSPWTPLTPRLQAVVWMPLDPPRAVPLFIEALRRQETLGRLSRGDASPVSYWSDVVLQTAAFPPVQDFLWEGCAGRQPEYALAWLENATAHNVQERLPKFAGDESRLAQFDAEQKRRLVSVWKAKGDPESLRAFLQSHGPEWQP